MTDDLVKRLHKWVDDLEHDCDYELEFELSGEEAGDFAADIRGALTRIENLEAALRNIAEGDIPRTVKIPFRDDGQSSKHDRCEHGQWFYEDCGCCIEDYARKALRETP